MSLQRGELMAIIIPSKNIFEPQSEKVKDNAIDRIEVNSFEIAPDNKIDDNVFGKNFAVIKVEESQKTIVKYEDGYALNAGGTTARNVRAASGLQYQLKYTTIEDILIPKKQNDKYISKVDDEVIISISSQQKTSYGLSSYNPSQNAFNFDYITINGEKEENVALFDGFDFKNDVSESVSSLVTSTADEITATHFIKEAESKIKVSSYLSARNTLNWTPKTITADAYVEASLIEGNLEVLQTTINGEEYYKIPKIKVLVEVDAIFMSSLLESSSALSTVNANAKAVVTKVLQESREVSINLHGNTIGIDLKDKTVYIGDSTKQKVYSVRQNELLQTSNTYKTGIKTPLRDGTDYTVRIINDSPDGIPFAEVKINFFTEGQLYLVEYVSGGYTNREILNKASTTVSEGGYYIDSVTVSEFYPWYYGVQKIYALGKETLTITCVISDYYDENGQKVISQDGTLPMAFNLYDKIIPMAYGTDGKDYPLSVKTNNTAKVFQVLGFDFIYDGEPLQKLYLQEITLENY